MKKEAPILAIILTLISLVPPMVFLFLDISYTIEYGSLMFHALSPILNLCAIALGIVSIHLCQKSVRENGQYLSAYILLVINSASIIINLIVAVLNKLIQMSVKG